MANITELIYGYLRNNRRLVIPEVGAFIVKESGQIIFSELLKSDDGQLGRLLADAGMSELEADAAIDRFVFELHNEVERYGYYRISPIGTLRLDPATRTLRLIEPSKEDREEMLAALQPTAEVVTEVTNTEVAAEAEAIEGVAAEAEAIDVATEVAAESVAPTEEMAAEEKPVTVEAEASEPAVIAEEKPVAAAEPVPVKATEESDETVPQAEVKHEPRHAKPRHRIDAIILAIVAIIAIIALAAMGYGWYKSYHKGEPNDAEQMEMLRDESFRTPSSEAEDKQ